MKRTQQGVTMVVVLILLTVMLLGGMALARMTEVGTLAAGNAAFRESALQASEVGINTAFAAASALADENVDVGGWYFATTQADDARGLPMINFDAAPEVVVGAYRVRYAVDRQCGGALPVVDPMRQCLVRVAIDPNKPESNDGSKKLDPPTTRQFRITVRVTGPKDTRVWAQALVNR
jgi:hypothetical protein